MRTVFISAIHHWIIVAAASVSLVSLTACDRNTTTDDLPARSDSIERPNDPNRSPVTPATPADPPVQVVPPLQPEAPAAPGTGGTPGTPGGTGAQ